MVHSHGPVHPLSRTPQSWGPSRRTSTLPPRTRIRTLKLLCTMSILTETLNTFSEDFCAPPCGLWTSADLRPISLYILTTNRNNLSLVASMSSDSLSRRWAPFYARAISYRWLSLRPRQFRSRTGVSCGEHAWREYGLRLCQISFQDHCAADYRRQGRGTGTGLRLNSFSVVPKAWSACFLRSIYPQELAMARLIRLSDMKTTKTAGSKPPQ